MRRSPLQVQNLVARHYDLTVAELRTRRDPRCCKARAVAMYLCRQTLMLSFPEVGRAFDRDHSSVMYAVRKVGHSQELLQDAEDLRQRLEGLKAEEVYCDHCGQRKDRRQALDDLRLEQERLAKRLASIEAG
jgi:chromosomal replication initiation ATPase DnaA